MKILSFMVSVTSSTGEKISFDNHQYDHCDPCGSKMPYRCTACIETREDMAVSEGGEIRGPDQPPVSVCTTPVMPAVRCCDVFTDRWVKSLRDDPFIVPGHVLISRPGWYLIRDRLMPFDTGENDCTPGMYVLNF